MCSNYAERVAKVVLERVIPGSSVCYRSDQSHNEWDFDLKYQNGETVAVEVTSSQNQTLTQVHSEIFNPRMGGSRIEAVQCRLTWLIRPDLNANIKAIRKKADKYLAIFESEGVLNFSALDRAPYRISEHLAQLRDELRLVYGKAISASGRAEIRMLGIVSGGAVGPATAIKAAEREFEPNRKKLGRARCSERHLVINIDQMNGGPWIAMADFIPPDEFPKLPQEITHVWLVAQTADDQFTVWFGNSNQQWQRIDLEGLSVNS